MTKNQNNENSRPTASSIPLSNPQDLDPDNQDRRNLKLLNYNVGKQAGWVMVKHNRFFKDQILEDRTFSGINEKREEKSHNGQIEFRLPILPTEENIRKASKVLLELYNDPHLKAPKLAKIVDIKKLKEKNYANWNPEVGEIRQHDQRGKELCFYVTWEKNKIPSLTPVEHKTFMLKALKAMIDAGVEGIGYYPSKDVDKGLNDPTINSKYPEIFTYLNFTSSDYTTFSHEKDYTKAGFSDPLKNIKITLKDYKKAGITKNDLRKIKLNQQNYLVNNYPKIYESYRNELTDALSSEMLSNKSWVAKVNTEILALSNNKNITPLKNLERLSKLFEEQSFNSLASNNHVITKRFIKDLSENPDQKLSDILVRKAEDFAQLQGFVDNINVNIEKQASIIHQSDKIDKTSLIKLGQSDPSKLTALSNTAKHLSNQERSYLKLPSEVKIVGQKELIESVNISARSLSDSISGLTQIKTLLDDSLMKDFKTTRISVTQYVDLKEKLATTKYLLNNVDYNSNKSFDVKKMVEYRITLDNHKQEIISLSNELKASDNNLFKVTRKMFETQQQAKELLDEKKLLVSNNSQNIDLKIIDIDKKLEICHKSLTSDLTLKKEMQKEISIVKTKFTLSLDEIHKVVTNLNHEIMPIAKHQINYIDPNIRQNKQETLITNKPLKGILKKPGEKILKVNQQFRWDEKLSVKIFDTNKIIAEEKNTSVITEKMKIKSSPKEAIKIDPKLEIEKKAETQRLPQKELKSEVDENDKNKASLIPSKDNSNIIKTNPSRPLIPKEIISVFKVNKDAKTLLPNNVDSKVRMEKIGNHRKQSKGLNI